MTEEERIITTRDMYIKNLEQKQKYYRLSDEYLGIAIKFVQSYDNYVLWTIRFDKGTK